MSKLTKYTAPIASIDSMGFPLQTERIIYLASDVDAHLATQREEINRLKLVYTPELRTIMTQQVATLQAELEAMTRKRDLLKNAYDVLSTDSDELLSRNTRLEQQLAAREGQVKKLEGALTHISEYWNGNENERAMADACYMAVDTALKALKPSA